MNSAAAKDACAPFAVLEKVRRGDRDVEISTKIKSRAIRVCSIFSDPPG
jgi:hypothetical protein